MRYLLMQVWNKLDNMNEQLAIKRSIQLQSIFGNGDAASAKELVSFLETERKFLFIMMFIHWSTATVTGKCVQRIASCTC
jgi:hypothetical protein